MSEVKKNAFFEPVPAFAKNAPLVFVTRWIIPKENHDKMVEFSTGIVGHWGMDTQRTLPLRVAYSRTRHWFRPSDDGKTEEWWFMDEYDSSEAFEAMQKLVAGNFSGPGAEAQKARHQQLLDLMVPGTTVEPIIYSEIESARIEFEPWRFRASALARAEAAGKKG
jgi:hypothetical protein